MLAMLMQLLMKCSDDVIVEDYYRSNAAFAVSGADHDDHDDSSSTAAAAAVAMPTANRPRRNRRGRTRMDKRVFRGTSRSAMVSTLEGLRSRHGAGGPFLEGYFDAIGFDSSWRSRFVAVFGRPEDGSRSISDDGIIAFPATATAAPPAAAAGPPEPGDGANERASLSPISRL